MKIPDISKENSEIILRYLNDMETGKTITKEKNVYIIMYIK